MAKYKEIVYLVLDEIKSLGSDQAITEDHVIFLADLYRMLLLHLKILKEGIASLSESNYQTLCIDLELSYLLPSDIQCNELVLKSKLKIPDLYPGTNALVSTYNQFALNVAIVSVDRFKFVGNNKYMRNIIYCCIGNDNYLYFKSSNPLFQYLEQAKVKGIFEDSKEAAELECTGDSDTSCDILERDFPLDGDLISLLIQLVVKELLAAEYRPTDDYNNDKDDIGDLATYIAKNSKSSLLKLISD